MANTILEDAINELYPDENISEQELKKISDDLINFFSILIEEVQLQNISPIVAKSHRD